MAIATEEVIRDMAAVLSRETDAEAIILFGSHAAGSAGPDSDVDLLVIESTPFRAENWFSSGAAQNHVLARALREGKLLYGKL